MPRTYSFLAPIGVLVATCVGTPAQTLSREYIRLGGRVVAIEQTAGSPSDHQVTIGVSPANVTLQGGQTQQFTATVTGAEHTSVSWSLRLLGGSGPVGTITTEGLYTAPLSVAQNGAIEVKATSVDYPDKSASATVTLWGTTTSGSYFPILGTFLNFYRNLTDELWATEFDLMKEVDINTIVIVAVGHLRTDPADETGYGLASDGLLYPSNWINAAERPTDDRLEKILSLADQRGMKVYLGSLQTEQDWTTGLEFNALRIYNKRVAQEVVQRYANRHPSLQGWYFTQEIWMNWVKYYVDSAGSYYGTALMADWVTDMKAVDAAKITTTAMVFKKDAYYSMPGLTAQELGTYLQGLLASTRIDVIMPQDGQGAGAGAPPLNELAAYFQQMAAAASGTHTAVWSTTETFTAIPGLSNDRFPPGDVLRIDSQVNTVRPYVSGYVSWIFGNDMSPQATYYPVEASVLNRSYRSRFKPQSVPNWSVLPMTVTTMTPQPDPLYPEGNPSKLTDGTGGGYAGYALDSWVGFSDPLQMYGTVSITGDLGAPRQINQVRSLTQSWLPSGIYYPSSMTVEVSSDGTNWRTFGTDSTFPSQTQDFSVAWGEVTASDIGRYVRLTFTRTEWLFLAEIEVLGIPDAPVPPQISVSVTPSSVTLGPSQSQSFIAVVSGAAPSVTWQLFPASQSGTITAGLYTAPASVPSARTVTVEARSTVDTSKYAWALVNLRPNPAPGLPVVGPMNPDSGSGAGHLFSFQAQPAQGDLQWVHVVFSTGSITPTSACTVFYQASSGTLSLSADNSQPTAYQWVGSGLPGSQRTLANSQCTLDLANSSVALNDSTRGLTINLSLAFQPSWAGTRNVYMGAADAVNYTAWPLVGYWTVTVP